MRRSRFYMVLFITVSTNCHAWDCNGQDTSEASLFNLQKIITLDGVKGKIGGMAIDLKKQVVYATAPENKSIQIIDLKNGVRIQSISCRFRPEYICYVPQLEEIFVTTSGNKCYFYSTTTMESTGRIRLVAPAIAVQYDSTARKIYVGYGDEGVIAIDIDKHKKAGELWWLPGPPEELLIDRARDRLYINIPAASVILSVDLHEFRVACKWHFDHSLSGLMAVDTLQNRLFFSYQKSSALVIMNAKTGKTVSVNFINKKVTSLFYDVKSRRLFMGDEGKISVFQEESTGFKQISGTKLTTVGSVLFVPQLNLCIDVNEIKKEKKTELLVYGVADSQK